VKIFYKLLTPESDEDIFFCHGHDKERAFT